jgi:hypothetical protein
MAHPYLTTVVAVFVIACFNNLVSQIASLFKKPQSATLNLMLDGRKPEETVQEQNVTRGGTLN